MGKLRFVTRGFQAGWEAFKNLKAARNSFVHEGVAQIGKRPVREAEARELVQRAADIVTFIKAKLPNEMPWPEYQPTTIIRIAKKISGT